MRPTDGARREGKSQAGATLYTFPDDARQRPGILGYRAPRTPGDVCRAIRNALDREARLARQTGVNTPPDVIEDISAWIARGCLP